MNNDTKGRRAFITGITGQDGSYLAELLLEKGYDVHGMVRRASTEKFERIGHLKDRVVFHQADLLDQLSIITALKEAEPHEVYNLAAQSFVPTSWSQPLLTGEFTALGVTRMLEAVRMVDPSIRFYQASSSEMFGKVLEVPQKETTPFYPRSPYGVAKVYGHFITVNYRESYDLFCVSGILFNHECVTADTPVIIRRNGLLDIVPIDEVVPHRTNPRSGLKYTTVPAEPFEVWDRGGWTLVTTMTATWNDPERTDFKPLRRIAARGACFTCTEDHVLFLANERESPAGGIETGEELALIDLPGPTDAVIMTETEAWFLGVMAAEGYVSERKAKFTCGDEDLVDEVERAWRSLTGCGASRSRGVSGFTGGNDTIQLHLIGSSTFARWLRQQLYTKAGKKRVPYRVLNGEQSVRKAFLKGYNAGDGLQAGHGEYEFKSFKTNSTVLAQGLWWLADTTLFQRTILCIEEREGRVYYQINLNSPNDVGDKGAHLRRPRPEVVKTSAPLEPGWLFDLATESGTFHAGIGAGWIHNSPRRGREFVTRHVSYGVARIALGLDDRLPIGNVNAKRDWGFAGDYVEAMWRMLQQDEPVDYVIGTGIAHSVQELIEIAFDHAGLDWEEYVRVDPERLRPAEVDHLLADPTKAREELGWEPKVSFEEMVKMMVDADIERLKEGTERAETVDMGGTA